MITGLLIVILVLTGGGFLPVTISVFAYARVEKRHRAAWAGLPHGRTKLGAGPYRALEIVTFSLQRAPLLVRAAALGCFYWSWFCLLTWAGIAIFVQAHLVILPVVVAGVTVAVCVARLGWRMLRRDTRVLPSGRNVALAASVFAIAVVLLASLLGGRDWIGPALVFALVSISHAALMAGALRRHAPLFALCDSRIREVRLLPTGLSRLLARQAQRRANFLARASQTRAGA